MELPAATCTPGLIGRIKELLAVHPGDLSVILRVVTDGEVTRLKLGPELAVDGSPALLSELRRLLGSEAVRLSPGDPVLASAR
jgi:DNA polymerase-3 subunit alpha